MKVTLDFQKMYLESVKDRVALIKATERLRAVNAKLLSALGSMPVNPRSLAEANDIIYNAKLRGAAAIEEARK